MDLQKLGMSALSGAMKMGNPLNMLKGLLDKVGLGQYLDQKKSASGGDQQPRINAQLLAQSMMAAGNNTADG